MNHKVRFKLYQHESGASGPDVWSYMIIMNHTVRSTLFQNELGGGGGRLDVHGVDVEQDEDDPIGRTQDNQVHQYIKGKSSLKSTKI